MKIKLILLLFFALATFVLISGNLPDTLAQSCSTSPRAEGLVTATKQDPTSRFGSLAQVCILDPAAAFVPFKIPTYDSLKSLYYDQPTTIKKIIITPPDLSNLDSLDAIYFKNGDLLINTINPNTSTAVIFVQNNLDIAGNITYGTPNTGLVFIVKGNIIIRPSVTTVNAVLISEGIIYTAGASCTNPTSAPQLTINGSLISLIPNNPIKFCRTLIDNTQAAEVINHQVKYLVILRNLIFDNPIKWAEVAQ